MPKQISDLAKLANAIGHLADVHDRRLGEIAQALESVAHQTKNLGKGNCMTELGAIEMLSKSVQDGLGELSTAISSAADSLAESGEKK